MARRRTITLPVIFGYGPDGEGRSGEVTIEIPNGMRRRDLQGAGVHGPSDRYQATVGNGYRLLLPCSTGGYSVCGRVAPLAK